MGLKPKEHQRVVHIFAPVIDPEMAQIQDAIAKIGHATEIIEEAQETIRHLLASRLFNRGN